MNVWGSGGAHRLYFQKVDEIRTRGLGNFHNSEQWVNGVRTTVRKTSVEIEGEMYYYYETMMGKFVSAGKGAN